MELPDKMPALCNFYGLLETELELVAVTQRFAAAGWTVSQWGEEERLEIAWGRLTLTHGNPLVVQGWLDRPDDHVAELLGVLGGIERIGVYQWINGEGRLWREMPFDESMLHPDDTRLPADIKASMLGIRASSALAPQRRRPWWRFWN